VNNDIASLLSAPCSLLFEIYLASSLKLCYALTVKPLPMTGDKNSTLTGVSIETAHLSVYSAAFLKPSLRMVKPPLYIAYSGGNAAKAGRQENIPSSAPKKPFSCQNTAKSKDSISPSLDCKLKSKDFTPQSKDFTSKSKDFTPQSKDLNPKSVDFNPQSKDFTSKSLDFNPQSKDFNPRSVDFIPFRDKNTTGSIHKET
jgi:hypothetical protein